MPNPFSCRCEIRPTPPSLASPAVPGTTERQCADRIQRTNGIAPPPPRRRSAGSDAGRRVVVGAALPGAADCQTADRELGANEPDAQVLEAAVVGAAAGAPAAAAPQRQCRYSRRCRCRRRRRSRRSTPARPRPRLRPNRGPVDEPRAVGRRRRRYQRWRAGSGRVGRTTNSMLPLLDVYSEAPSTPKNCCDRKPPDEAVFGALLRRTTGS